MKLLEKSTADLSFDPANVRKHNRKNLDAIKASLRRFGQQKPIVVSPAGVVIAGNGTLEAALELGWETIQVIETDLAGVDRVAYAIADNRTAELAEWDEKPLVDQLLAIQNEGLDLLVAGFDDADLARLMGQEEKDAKDLGEVGDLAYRIVLECKDEVEQADLLEEFETRGLKCQALMS